MVIKVSQIYKNGYNDTIVVSFPVLGGGRQWVE